MENAVKQNPSAVDLRQCYGLRACISEIENFWVSSLAAKDGVWNVWRQRSVGGCASFVIADGFDEVSVRSKVWKYEKKRVRPHCKSVYVLSLYVCTLYVGTNERRSFQLFLHQKEFKTSNF